MIDVSIGESSIPRNRCPWACASGRAFLFDSAYGKGFLKHLTKNTLGTPTTRKRPSYQSTASRDPAALQSTYLCTSGVHRGGGPWPVAPNKQQTRHPTQTLAGTRLLVEAGDNRHRQQR